MKRYSISFWGVFLLASGSSGPDLSAKLETNQNLLVMICLAPEQQVQRKTWVLLNPFNRQPEP